MGFINKQTDDCLVFIMFVKHTIGGDYMNKSSDMILLYSIFENA